MKKRLFSIIIVVFMFLGSAVPTFAATRLDRPVIDTITAKTSGIKISWDSVDDADSYYVYRSTSKDGKYKRIADTEDCVYQDSSAKQGKKYYYKVRAISDGEYTNSYLSKWRSAKIKKTTAKSLASSGGTSSETVYITETGSKYHSAGCRTLHDSCIKTTLSKAKSAGYEPCGICLK